MIDTAGAKARLERAMDTLRVARSEVESAQIALDNVNAINGFIECVTDRIRRIVNGHNEAQRRRFGAMLTEFKPEEWAEQVSNFVPENLYNWLSGKTIVGNDWILSRFDQLRIAPSGNYTLWGFANELIKYLPKDDSVPPVVLRRPDAFSIEIAFAKVDDQPVNTTP